MSTICFRLSSYVKLVYISVLLFKAALIRVKWLGVYSDWFNTLFMRFKPRNVHFSKLHMNTFLDKYPIPNLKPMAFAIRYILHFIHIYQKNLLLIVKSQRTIKNKAWFISRWRPTEITQCYVLEGSFQWVIPHKCFLIVYLFAYFKFAPFLIHLNKVSIQRLSFIIQYFIFSWTMEWMPSRGSL